MELKINEAINEILETLGSQTLKILLFNPIEANEHEEFLARLFHYVSPSYLPFASDDSGILVVHLRPDRVLEASPILYIPNDEQNAKFICDSFASLPTALWLWVCTYFRSNPETLRYGIESMTNSIPYAHSFPEELWSFLEDDPVRWSLSDSANNAWAIANVGHPFAGVPRLSIRNKPQEALEILTPFIEERKDIPEALAVLLAIRSKLGLQNQLEDVVKILSAEAWRDLDGYLKGRWRVNGQGICEWDSTLSSIDNPDIFLTDTPFHELSGSSNVYSGDDKNASYKLLNVAKEFEKNGQRREELSQLRNAATLSLLTLGEYTSDLCLAIADSCDAIADNSLAASVARESARVSKQGP